MDRRDILLKQIAKYSIFAFAVFVLYILQSTPGFLSVFGIKPVFILPFCIVLAMLDDYDSGFVLNAIHSREGCYTYIKEIKRGSSYVELSGEEQIALEKAMHQDRYFEEDREGIPTGYTGNLKRAYTVAVRKEEAREKARRMKEREAAQARKAEEEIERVMSREE